MKRASKIQILEYINKKEIVTPLDLMNDFGYSSGGARWMLSWLKRQGLIINERRGQMDAELAQKAGAYHKRPAGRMDNN